MARKEEKQKTVLKEGKSYIMSNTGLPPRMGVNRSVFKGTIIEKTKVSIYISNDDANVKFRLIESEFENTYEILEEL